jgi:hypothetical protein
LRGRQPHYPLMGEEETIYKAIAIIGLESRS